MVYGPHADFREYRSEAARKLSFYQAEYGETSTEVKSVHAQLVEARRKAEMIAAQPQVTADAAITLAEVNGLHARILTSAGVRDGFKLSWENACRLVKDKETLRTILTYCHDERQPYPMEGVGLTFSSDGYDGFVVNADFTEADSVNKKSVWGK